MENKRIKIQPITKERLHSLPAMVKNIKIGNQIWSAENYNGIVCPNGDTLIKDIDYHIYEDDVFYTFDAALRVVPKGWHIPSSIEWDELLKKCGYRRYELLSTGYGNGKDTIGFNVKYTGYFGLGNKIVSKNKAFRFWVSEEYDSENAKYIYGEDTQYYVRKIFCPKYFALTIRLIRN